MSHHGSFAVFTFLLLGAWCLFVPVTVSAAASTADFGAALAEARSMRAAGMLDRSIPLPDGTSGEEPEWPLLLNAMAVRQAGEGDLAAANRTLELAMATMPIYSDVYRNLMTVKQTLALRGYQQTLDLDAEAPVLALTSIEPAAPSMPEALPEADVVEADPEAFVRAWADAWSEQDVDAYLASYADGFSDSRYEEPENWMAYRRDRLTSPAWIRVALNNLQVERTGPASAIAEFDQAYQSNTYQDETHKVLWLEGEPSRGWYIVKEYVVQ